MVRDPYICVKSFNFQREPAPPLLIDQNGPQSPPKEGQEDNPSDNEESHPVQETEPTS